ncbi:MAG TPA: hypothetical protein VGQ13_07955 [Nitrososphaera sp.]|nr:hypothetical protein [Nitrososphaera sp.]
MHSSKMEFEVLDRVAQAIAAAVRHNPVRHPFNYTLSKRLLAG